MPAFGRYDKKRKTEITDIPEWQKVMTKVLDADIAAAKKSVRWNFLKDNEGMLNLSLVLSPALRTSLALTNKKDPVKILRENKISERDYISGFDEIAKGIETGRHDLTTSLG